MTRLVNLSTRRNDGPKDIAHLCRGDAFLLSNPLDFPGIAPVSHGHWKTSVLPGRCSRLEKRSAARRGRNRTRDIQDIQGDGAPRARRARAQNLPGPQLWIGYGTPEPCLKKSRFDDQESQIETHRFSGRAFFVLDTLLSKIGFFLDSLFHLGDDQGAMLRRLNLLPSPYFPASRGFPGMKIRWLLILICLGQPFHQPGNLVLI